MARARRIEARLFPRGWPDALRQLLLFAAAYYGYRLVRGLVDGKVAEATWNATKVILLEHDLGFFVEPSVQSWAVSTGWIEGLASWLYVNSHFVVTFAALVWLYRFRNPAFYWVRNMFMVAMLLALVGYVLFPTAPPRLMPQWGFTDSVADFTGIDDSKGAVGALVNLYAAVPSMHVAFALMIGWPLAVLVRPRPLRALWALYPLLVTFVVVVTGNHFLFDVVLGALTAGLSAVVAERLLARARPGAWAFERPPAEAPA